MTKQKHTIASETVLCQDVPSTQVAGATASSQPENTARSAPHALNHTSATVPVYSADAALLGHITEFEADIMIGVRLIRNRRGHIKRVYLNGLTCLVVKYGDTPGYGAGFEQHLDGSKCFALKGTVGSK